MKYLITGATGDVGSRVVDRLLERGIRPRVLVRNQEKARSLFGDRVDVFVGDMALPNSIRTAFDGAHAVFLVNVGPDIPQRDRVAAEIAIETGVKRIVKLSSLDVEHGLALGVWHERGEAAIRELGVPATFVRPSGFMSNLLAWKHSIKDEGLVRSSTADGRRPFIHSDDIASVCMAALLSDDYIGRTLPLTGPDSLTFADATQIIGAAIGKPLSYQAISDDEARMQYARVSGSPVETEAHVALWRAIREGKLADTTECVELVLGRRPISLRQWADEHASSFMN